jgi:hypothetical protein
MLIAFTAINRRNADGVCQKHAKGPGKSFRFRYQCRPTNSGIGILTPFQRFYMHIMFTYIKYYKNPAQMSENHFCLFSDLQILQMQIFQTLPARGFPFDHTIASR